ncbi:MAG TPA: hypothetical protein VK666_14410 [Chryseolinea sp.]|nr:hypothetical protein [Chryseolinea sp.]
MKNLFSVCLAIVLLSGCQKDLSVKEEVNVAVVASEANSPLNCHTLSFTSDYPVQPGEVPPFSFTKTQYPDARIRTIKMLSRKNPIHPAFKKEAVELTGTFTYEANQNFEEAQQDPHVAYFTGISEVWEYYKTSSGAGARRSVLRKGVNYRFTLNPAGYCTRVIDINAAPLPNYLLELTYHPTTRRIEQIIDHTTGSSILYSPIPDQYGNITSFETSRNPEHYFRIEYDYGAPRGTKNFSFIPSQNLISQEYSLLEVMQWLPQNTHQRKSAGGSFLVNGVYVNQDQVYKNYMFDAQGNQISLTYGDNVLQKTTWHCQN